MTKITIITQDDGNVEVKGDAQGGKPFDLLMGLHAHVDCLSTILKQPKQTIIAHLTLLCQVIDENSDKMNRTAVEIKLPHNFKEE